MEDQIQLEINILKSKRKQLEKEKRSESAKNLGKCTNHYIYLSNQLQDIYKNIARLEREKLSRLGNNKWNRYYHQEKD